MDRSSFKMDIWSQNEQIMYWQQKANQSNIYYCVIVYDSVTAIFSQGNSIKKCSNN